MLHDIAARKGGAGEPPFTVQFIYQVCQFYIFHTVLLKRGANILERGKGTRCVPLPKAALSFYFGNDDGATAVITATQCVSSSSCHLKALLELHYRQSFVEFQLHGPFLIVVHVVWL